MSGTFCSVAEQGCKAPAGTECHSGYYVSSVEEGDPEAKASCHVCGDAVCVNPGCSKRVRYDGRRVRLCWNCQLQEKS